MRIPSLYAARQPVFSLEFFPPKTAPGYPALFRTIEELKRSDPAFVSVTCGASGSTRIKTAELVIQIQRELGITAMAHMTCTGQTREQLATTLGTLAEAGIENVLALRGDPPKDEPEWQPVPGGFRHANELAAFVRESFDFAIGGACYPEVHHQAESPEADIENLKQKIDAGAEFLITQLFLDNAHYFRFVDRARAAGIEVPLVPGLMPMIGIRNLQAAMRLSPGSETPAELEASLEAVAGDAERSIAVGVEWATLQARELLEQGAPGIHFYTLNKSPATRQVHANLVGG
jgi:methylenetetrahydrofolate reductase (NADPH)